MSEPTRLSRREWLTTLLGGTAALALPCIGRAQAPAPEKWPVRPVRLVVGFPAGTSPDLKARALAPPLSQALGQPVIVENRTGAGGGIGADVVAKATDAHTFGVMGQAALTSVPVLYPNLPYAMKDLKPLTVIGTSPQLIVAANGVSFGTAAEFFQAARSAGDRWSYGSLGIGSGAHLATELLKAKAGFAAVHVPYNAAPAVITAMIGGDIHMAVLPIGTALTQVKAGKIKSVAVTSAVRTPLAPDVPALQEAGIDSLNIEIWNAVVAPATAPAPIVARLTSEVTKIIRSDEMRQILFKQGWIADGGTPEALERRIRGDTAMYREIITLRKIKVDS